MRPRLLLPLRLALLTLAFYTSMVSYTAAVPTPATSAGPNSSRTPTPTQCTITLAPRTLVVACSGPGPVSLAPLPTSSTPFNTPTLSGTAFSQKPPIPCPLHRVTTPASPTAFTDIALVTLCSTAASLHITATTITGVTLPAGSNNSTTASSRAMASPAAAAALAVVYTGPSLHISNLTAHGVSGGSALLVRAEASAGATVTISNCTFSNNSAPANSGGGLALQLLPAASSPQQGGARDSSGSSGVVLEGNSFAGNRANSGGGAAVQLLHAGATDSSVPVSITLRGTNTFRGCEATTGGGGALLVSGPAGAQRVSVLLTGSALFQDNRAKGAGGGVWVSLKGAVSPAVEVSGVVDFSGNQGGEGGGLAVDMSGARNGSVVVAGTAVFNGSTATGGFGGGLLLNASRSASVQLHVAGSAVFLRNSCGDGYGDLAGGGGVAAVLAECEGCGVIVAGNATFVRNRAGSAAGVGQSGGGLLVHAFRCSECAVQLAGAVQFVGNMAGDGGGAYFQGVYSDGARVELRGHLAFINNTATFSGGGMVVWLERSKAAHVVMLEASHWVGNRATHGGGGCWMKFDRESTHVEIAGSHLFINNLLQADQMLLKSLGDSTMLCETEMLVGGGLHIAALSPRNVSAMLSGLHFVGNEACFGGGLYVQHRLVDDDEIYLGNVTEAKMTLNLTDATFTNNLALSQGGGMWVDVTRSSGARVAVSGSRWVGNSAVSGGGGLGIMANESTVTAVRMRGLEVVNNTVQQGAGGGLLLLLGQVTADNVQLLDIYMPGDRENLGIVTNDIFVSLTDSVLSGNVAASGVGGGICLHGTSAAVDRAGLVAGRQLRLAAPDEDDLGLSMAGSNLTLMNNQATYGGAWYVAGSQVRVRGSMLARNQVEWHGGALYLKTTQLQLEECQVVGNRAGWSGGGVYSATGDDFSSNTIQANRTDISRNVALSQGGGLYLQAGATFLASTNISSNRAGQQGGGIAFVNICGKVVMPRLPTSNTTRASPSVGALRPNPDASGCTLQLLNGTRLVSNAAVAGRDVFVAMPGNKGVDRAQLLSAAADISSLGTYASGVSFAPNNTAVSVQQSIFTVPSSTGSNGLIWPLEANVGQAGLQVAVKLCDSVEVGNWLEDGAAGSQGATDAAYLIGMTEVSRQGGTATFQSLRLLQGTPRRTYCLQVHTPDYPSVTPARLNVTIRDCLPGEIKTLDGCSTCPANQFSFSPLETQCPLCSPYANCTGGPVFVPKPGFWHSAPNSANVQPCPNRKACQGARAPLHACQTGRNCSRGYSYHTLQCSEGYGGHLCGSCRKDLGYGQGAYLRCARCMSRSGSVTVLLVVASACCCLVVWVAYKSLRESLQQLAAANPGSGASLPPRGAAGALVLPRSGTAAPHSGTVVLPSQASDGLQQQPSVPLSPQSTGSPPPPMYDPHPPSSPPPPGSQSTPSTDLHPVTGAPMLCSQTSAPNTPSATSLRSRPPRAAVMNHDLELSDVFKVLVVHLQYLSIVGNLLVDWPSALRTLIDVVRMLFVTSSSQIVSWDCLGNLGNGSMGVLAVAVPLGIVVLAGAAMWLLSALPSCLKPGKALWLSPQLPTTSLMVQGAPSQRGGSSSSGSGMARNGMAADAVITTALVGVFLFYSVLVSSSLTAFSCVSVDNASYWIRDMEVQCWTRQHLQASMGLGVLGTLVFCLFVPAATIWWLAKNQARVGQPGFHQRYGFLYRLYRPRYCYWEGVVCLQTIALVCVDLFGRRYGSFYQLLLLVTVLVVNYSTVAALRPFRCVQLQLLYAASTVTLLLTCLGVQSLLPGYLLDTVTQLLEGARNALIIALLALNLGFICTCLYLLAQAAAGAAKKLVTAASMALSHRSFKLLAAGVRKPSTLSLPRARQRAPAAGSSWHRSRSGKSSAAPGAVPTQPAQQQAQQQEQQQPPQQQQEQHQQLGGLSDLASVVSDNQGSSGV